MVDAVSKVMQYDYDGKLVREVELPGVGSAGGFGSKKDDKELYFSFTNYVTPEVFISITLKKEQASFTKSPEIDFNPKNYESKQVFYTSKDGTKVPMIITHKKGSAIKWQESNDIIWLRWIQHKLNT